jgi:hypothetical protein
LMLSHFDVLVFRINAGVCGTHRSESAISR